VRSQSQKQGFFVTHLKFLLVAQALACALQAGCLSYFMYFKCVDDRLATSVNYELSTFDRHGIA
jgi:hypothetical protein